VTASGVDRGESLSQACELKVRLKDGSTRFIQQADAEGRAADDYPAYMETKFTDCVSQVFDPAYVTQLLPQLRSFERCANVTTVMGLLAQSRPAATKKAMQS